MTTLLIRQVLIMFMLAGVGYLCFRSKKITLEGSKNIGNILIWLSLPCVIINSFLVECTKERLTGLLISSLAAAAVMLVSILVSRVFFSKDAILCFASSFSNPGFFGIPLIAATLSDGAVFYVATFIVFVNLLQWSYGVALLTVRKERQNSSWKQFLPSPKRIFTAPFMIACIIGLFFFLTGLPMPGIIREGIQYIAGLNTPLAMFTIGIYLAQTDLLKIFRKTSLYLLSAVRLLVIPLLSMLVLWLVPPELGDMKMALLIVSACPVGSNVAVYAQLYDSDHAYAVQTVVISTLLSVITIPLVVRIAELLQFI